MDAAKREIINTFLIKDFNLITHYLSIYIKRDKEVGTIYFTQTATINRILKKIEIINYSLYQTLIEFD